MSDWWSNLGAHASNRYSQGGEDGVIAEIFRNIGTKNRYAIEFGAGDGFTYSNTRALREDGWDGLMLEADPKHANDMVKTAFITAENIVTVLGSHGVPDEPDLLSIDIDGNDWYVWRALKSTGGRYWRPRARLVVIEFNRMWHAEDCVTIEYDADFRHDGSDYHGASLGALRKLGRTMGYTLIHHQGVNLFFLAHECLPVGMSEPELQFEAVHQHPPDTLGRTWATV